MHSIIYKNSTSTWDEALPLGNGHFGAMAYRRSGVSIPDKLLEKLWYMNLYSLECSSGKGARLYQQACGLSGLWNIRQPTQ